MVLRFKCYFCLYGKSLKKGYRYEEGRWHSMSVYRGSRHWQKKKVEKFEKAKFYTTFTVSRRWCTCKHVTFKSLCFNIVFTILGSILGKNVWDTNENDSPALNLFLCVTVKNSPAKRNQEFPNSRYWTGYFLSLAVSCFHISTHRVSSSGS